MKKFTTGIQYFDKNLNNLEERQIYLLKSNYSRLIHLFNLHLMFHFLADKQKVLMITSQNPDLLFQEAQFLGYDIQKYLETQFLIMLETPAEMELIISNPNNISLVYDDLTTYINEYKPDLVIFDSLKDFSSHFNQVNTKLIINRLFTYFKDIPSTVMVDYSNLDPECQSQCEKLSNGVFTFKYHFQNPVHSLNYHDFSNNFNHNMLFILESFKYFTYPHIQINTNVSIHDVDTVFHHPEVQDLNPILNKFLSKQTQYIQYENIDDIEKNVKNEQKTIVFIPSFSKSFNGLEFARKVRNKYINIKIILIDNQLTTPNQKVRSIRLGANRLLSYPYDEKILKEILLNLYPSTQVSDSNFKISIHYKNNIDLNTDINSNIYYEAVYRVMKEKAQKAIEEAHSLQFFKTPVNDIEKVNIISFYKQFKQLIALMEFKTKNDMTCLVAVFDNLSEKEIHKVMQSVQISINSSNVHFRNNTAAIIKNLLADDNITNNLSMYDEGQNKILYINYPFDNTDIDVVLKRIY